MIFMQSKLQNQIMIIISIYLSIKGTSAIDHDGTLYPKWKLHSVIVMEVQKLCFIQFILV